MTFVQRYQYQAAVFVTGACVLIVEIVAIRLLAPYYGTTTFTVSSVLSTILAALSFGYYLGGQLADRRTEPRLFYLLILGAGIALLILHLAAFLVLPLLSLTLPFLYGPLAAAVILFLVPAVLLGTLSPFAVKLESQNSEDEGVGSISGRVFFWSTFGSIIGSLLAGFILIPYFGIGEIFIGVGIVLVMLGLIPLLLTKHIKYSLTALLLFLVAGSVSAASFLEQPASGVLHQQSGRYEQLLIYEDVYHGRPVRVLQQDRSLSGGMFLDTADQTDLAYDYTKYYSLYKLFTPDIERAFFIGGGAYTVPKALWVELPDVVIDVAEIEPDLFTLAKQYFSVPDDDRLNNHVADGRHFLGRTDVQYDLIFGDAYATFNAVPAHLTTKEFLETVRDRLTPDGVFMMNLVGDLYPGTPSLVLAQMNTFQNVFPQTYFFAVDSPDKTTLQNIILVGHKREERIDMIALRKHSDPLFQEFGWAYIDPTRFDLTNQPIFTDNYAPVESLSGAVLSRQQSR